MDETTPRVLFWHYIEDEPVSVQAKLADKETGPYLFFRRSKTPIQARLAQLFPHNKVPIVSLHGSPHIDNYAKTNYGFGIIDFDRAYIGPYIWDLVCVLLAINLRNPETHLQPIPKTVWQVFYDSYTYHFQHPELAYRPFAPLEFIHPKKWESNIDLYLNGNHKWAKKLRHAELSLDDPIANAVLDEYKIHLPNPTLLADYQLKQVARAAGSFGRRRYLYLLLHPDKVNAPVMLDIKETRNYLDADWPHNTWYQSPCHHQGERMVKAAMLYAPDCVRLESFATVNGIQYWGREVPTLNRKPAKCFDEGEQTAFAESAASQLGRGHRLGLQNSDPKLMQKHIAQHFTKLVQITEKIQSELLEIWHASIKEK
jgi:uncharacterized protein (DUF2252 family)